MQTPAPSLHSLLAGETTAMDEFIRLLEQEQAALQAGNTEALGELGAQKVTLVGKLNKIGEERNLLLKASGLPPDRVGVETWISRNGADTAVPQLWNRLKACVSKARELNLLNGKLIAMRMEHNQQLLGALLSSHSQSNKLYGPDGQPAQLSGRRIIDSA